MNQSLHPEINHFPVWSFESRILQHEWATTTIAVIFSYMQARFSFHNKNGRGYFESYEVIAKATGVCVRTAKAAVKVLCDNSHLTIKKRKTTNSLVNSYIVKDVYGTWNVKSQKANTNIMPSQNAYPNSSEDDLPEWARENETKVENKPKAIKHGRDYYINLKSNDEEDDEKDSPF